MIKMVGCYGEKVKDVNIIMTAVDGELAKNIRYFRRATLENRKIMAEELLDGMVLIHNLDFVIADFKT